MRVAVTSVLSATAFGTIVGAVDEDGRRLRVRTSDPEPLAIGDVVDVHGEEKSFSDQHGIHIQIDAPLVLRARTTGALVVPWLATLPGIGRTRARRLAETFGDDLIDVLRDRRRLDDVAAVLAPAQPATGARLSRRLFVEFASRDATETVGMAEGAFMARLEKLGLDDIRAARRLWQLIGSVDAFEKLTARPYLAAGMMAWEKVESLGRSILAARMPADEIEHHPDRLVGAVDACWRDILARGSTAAAPAMLERRLQRLGVTPARAIRLAQERHRTTGDDRLLRAPGAAYLERCVADHVDRLRRTAASTRQVTAQPVDVRGLSEEQRTAVDFVSARPLSVLHGGAGVGKTTTMRAVCAAHEAAGWRVLLCAISGKAALRLARATGRLAYTVARVLLALDAQADDPPPVEPHGIAIEPDTLLVVDEASMVDLVSWSRLLAHVSAGARVVMVGDPAQLPPVGLGRVFHDLVERGVDVFRLGTVVRQGAGNPIIDVSAQLREGRLPPLPRFAGREPGVFHIDCRTDEIEPTALELHRELVLAPDADLLMVAARNATGASIARTIQADRRSRGRRGVRFGPLLPWVSVGEPVVATANRYAEALTNGLMGEVVSLEPPTFRFDGEREPRQVSDQALWELASAWCVTVHRAQGSEADTVIVLLDAPGMMNREWLYTAITRATRQVVLVGPREHLDGTALRREQRVTGMPVELARIDRHAATSWRDREAREA